MSKIHDEKRLEAVDSYNILNTLPEKEYDDITRLASIICDVPVSLVSVISGSKQFFKSHYGVDISETPVDVAFCAHAIESTEDIFIVEDARQDERFSANPLVVNDPNIVFYAGVPLIDEDKHALGTLCVIDVQPKSLTDDQVAALKILASQVMQLFILRKSKLELAVKHNELNRKTKRLNNIITSTKVGTWEWDVKQDVVQINENWASMVGYTVDELQHVNLERFVSLIHKDDREKVQQEVEKCFRKEIDFYDVECRLVHKDGHIVWIITKGQVMSWDSENQPEFMSGIHVDISKDKILEAQFSTITDNIPGVVFRYILFEDGTDKLDLITEGARKLWGFTPEDVTGNSDLLWSRIDSEDLSTAKASIIQSAKEGSEWQTEWRYNHPDGTVRWHKGKGTPLDVGEGVTIWDTIVTDITEEKKIQHELEQSEKRFKALVQEGSDLIGILDGEANYMYVSPTSTQVLGIPPEDFIGKNAFDFIHPDDKEKVFAKFSALAETKQMTIAPFRFQNSEGEWRWVETAVTNLLDDPTIEGIVANSRDVTERIRTNMKLRESEQRYADLFQINPQPMFIYDLESLQFLDVNQAAIDHYGYDREQFLNFTIRDIRPEEGVEKMLQGVDKLRRDSSLKDTHTTHVHKKIDGTEIIVEIKGRVIDFKGHRVELVLATDVTKLLENIEAIEKQNEKLTKIAWTQSHVVRAPLASLMGLVSLLKYKKENQTEQDKILELIDAVAHDLDNIISEVVAISTE